MTVLEAMHSIDPCAHRGALVSVRDLRLKLGTGAALDAELLRLARSGRLSLHAIDDAYRRTAAELSEMVFLPDARERHCGTHPRGRYFIGAAIRQS